MSIIFRLVFLIEIYNFDYKKSYLIDKWGIMLFTYRFWIINLQYISDSAARPAIHIYHGKEGILNKTGVMV